MPKKVVHKNVYAFTQNKKQILFCIIYGTLKQNKKICTLLYSPFSALKLRLNGLSNRQPLINVRTHSMHGMSRRFRVRAYHMHKLCVFIEAKLYVCHKASHQEIQSFCGKSFIRTVLTRILKKLAKHLNGFLVALRHLQIIT